MKPPEATHRPLAYRDEKFLDSEDGRPLRILAEYLGPLRALLYGSDYWNEIINFDALVRHGMISREDLELFRYADDPATALGLLQAEIAAELEGAAPAFARSLTSRQRGD